MILLQSQFRHTRAHRVVHLVLATHSFSQPLQAHAPAVIFGTSLLTRRSAKVFNLERMGPSSSSTAMCPTEAGGPHTPITLRPHRDHTGRAHSRCANDFSCWPAPQRDADNADVSRDLCFRLLGPWEVAAADGPVHVPAGRLRTLLTALVLAAGEPVGLDRLADQVWPAAPPHRARKTLHTYLGRLRKLLGPELVRTHPGGGYLLDVAPDAVDVHRFHALLRGADRTDSAQVELDLLCEALALWRGRPFADLSSPWLDRDVLPSLTENWFAATGRRIDLELATGRPERLIAELRDLTGRHPTRESLWLRLITAQHRAGRRAEALGTFQHVRTLLSDELGIDPSEQLVALQRDILLDGAPPAREHCPHQLPHDVTTFTGRHAELAELDGVLTRLGSTIVSLDGPPGVGKTTLAVHWAHRVAARCPEVQLHVDLHGYGPEPPVPPAMAAARLLRALGVHSEQIPRAAEERFAALRTALAGRHALLLLDNARDAEQVRPLLPGTAALVVVTSRDQLRGLSVRDGAYRMTVPPLPASCAVELLAARAPGPPADLAQLAALCDHLPLALVIAAERVQRAGSAGAVVAALTMAPLDTLDSGDGDPHTNLRVALSWSYDALGPDAAALFRALGALPAGTLDLDAAATHAGLSPARAAAAFDRLTAANLVTRHGMRALVHRWAGELAGHGSQPAALLGEPSRLGAGPRPRLPDGGREVVPHSSL
jgi:DNA-binding SARP family transcriptional activator